MKRRQGLVVGAVAVLIGIAALTLLVVLLSGSGHSTPPRDTGALAKAVTCARPGAAPAACSTADRISTDPNQAALIAGDGTSVTWYSADGRQWQTTLGSSQEALRIFADNGYTNFRQDNSSTSAFTAILLPNIVLFGLFGLLLAGILIAVVMRRGRHSSPPAPPPAPPHMPDRCSFCGAPSTGPGTLFAGFGAAICGPCAERSAAHLRASAEQRVPPPPHV